MTQDRSSLLLPQNYARTVAADHGWTVIKLFMDRPTTVRRGKDRRPGEAALLHAIRSGGVQKVLVWSIDRVGRSLVELVGFFETCRMAGAGLYLHDQAIDTATSNGMSLFDLCQMMAFHLRQGRRDGILRGLAAVRATSSVRFGRPPIPAAKVERAKQFLAVGKGVRAVARLAGISATSVSRLKATMETGIGYRLTPPNHGFPLARRGSGLPMVIHGRGPVLRISAPTTVQSSWPRRYGAGSPRSARKPPVSNPAARGRMAIAKASTPSCVTNSSTTRFSTRSKRPRR
jgi:DNA invertase Pin-like site-specific DNA recombinase